MITVSGKELGIDQCNYVSHGVTAGEVVKDMFDHLEHAHDMKMPSVDDALDLLHSENEAVDWTLAPVVNARLPLEEGVVLVLRRLKEKLHLPNTTQDNRGY